MKTLKTIDEKKYDLVIENGTVVFGSFKEKEILNIGIIGDKIEIISKDRLYGKKIIDAKNLYVTPGFIDVHSHSDISGFIDESCSSKIYQGVTSEINGNCGIGISPWSDENRENLKKYIQTHSDINYYPIDLNKTKSFLDLNRFLEKEKLVTNQGFLIGAGCIRIAVMGFKSSEANESEIEKMKMLLEKQFDEGALGISFGLIYQPGNFMSQREILELLKVVKKYDKVASFHMRDEVNEIEKSIEEVIYYGRETKAKVNVSHLKVMNRKNWGKSRKIIEMLEKAWKSGVLISFDQYPYEATCTNLFVLIPQNVFDGDIETFIKEIPNFSDKVMSLIRENIEKRGGSKNIVVSNSYLKDTYFNGKTISEISKYLNLSEEETVLYILEKSKGKAQAIYFSMDLEDVKEFFKSDLGVIASDGNSLPMEDKFELGNPHPRNFGTFPKYIWMNKDEVSIEKIINRITERPAKLFRLEGRGEIKNGNFADITIFDLDKIKDSSTFQNSFQCPVGIEYVVINGKIVLEEGTVFTAKAGTILVN
ncbi:amidohydrolase family protein (plasmid) [Cetobacterium somerae]|uniref:N-acyl-D-amino-acid deacylase family protein n=1 Tax=Cetobacterium somerae TaxID=188913 RepID=UPI002E7BA1AD|nr:amidohydrolase family protein [Cetobacterium somerae]WVJ02897.1 amidohydrolase family protein [Cetobacterium somerae]